MEFEWSETKRLKVFADRGLDFLEGRELFDGRPVVRLPSPRGNEERWMEIGEIGGRLVVVVWCRRSEKVRIITMRRARDAEARRYRELYG
jgi:uncharacterized DUF497 family protein